MEAQPSAPIYFRSLPLLWFSVAFLAGIFLASLLVLPLLAWLLAAAASALAAIGLRRRLNWLAQFALVAACALLLGAARLQSAQPAFTPADLAFYNDTGERVEIRGVVYEPPVARDTYLELRIEAESVLSTKGVQSVSGRLIARTPLGNQIHYGERVLLRGNLVTPKEYEDFSYRDYLAREGIYSLLPFSSVTHLASDQGSLFWAALYGLRARGVELLYQLYPPQEAALLAGILLGDESGISDAALTSFNETGTRHIIAISGFNISIIAGLLISTFSRWVGRARGLWLAGAGIALYTLLVGADASVVRAAIMALLGLLALQTGRQQLALNTLAITAGVMALLNPLVLWDVGFQLSFAATLGLILFAGRLSRWTHALIAKRYSKDWANHLRGPLNDYVFMTLAAQITTFPLLWFYFQQVSLLSLPANLLILPAQPALMVFGGLSLMLGLVFLPLGQVVALFAWGFVAYTIRVVELFATYPLMPLIVSLFLFVLGAGLYAVLAFGDLRSALARLRQIRLRPTVILVGLAVACLLIWNSALASPDGMLQLTLLDVDGEAILIRTPTGRSLLVNAGPSLTRLSDELGRELPLGEKLDWLLLTGSGREQSGALSASLQRFAPSALATAVDLDQVVSADAVKLGVPHTELHSGDVFDLGSGGKLVVLAADGRTAVLLLEWRGFSAVLAGANAKLVESLEFHLPAIDLLLLADSAPLSPEHLATLAPQVIWVVSDGDLSEDTQESLHGFRVLTNNDHDWLRLVTNGKDVWLEAGNP